MVENSEQFGLPRFSGGMIWLILGGSMKGIALIFVVEYKPLKINSMIYGISLVLLSIIAVPSLILSRKPNAQELLEKIEPYQGWIGLVFCFWGVWGIIQAFLNLTWLSVAPIWWITLLAGSIVEVGLGFMLGFGQINKLFLSNNPNAIEKARVVRSKIAPLQGKLGLLGIIVGAWMIAASFIYSF